MNKLIITFALLLFQSTTLANVATEPVKAQHGAATVKLNSDKATQALPKLSPKRSPWLLNADFSMMRVDYEIGLSKSFQFELKGQW